MQNFLLEENMLNIIHFGRNLLDEPGAREAFWAFVRNTNENLLLPEELDAARQGVFFLALGVPVVSTTPYLLYDLVYLDGKYARALSTLYLFGMQIFYNDQSPANVKIIAPITGAVSLYYPLKVYMSFNTKVENPTEILLAVAKTLFALLPFIYFLGYVNAKTAYAATTIGSRTPLHRAAERDITTMFKLVKAGAHRDRRDNDGRLASEIFSQLTNHEPVSTFSSKPSTIHHKLSP